MPLTQVFVSISDPRSARHTRHDLAELLTVAVCAVLGLLLGGLGAWLLRKSRVA